MNNPIDLLFGGMEKLAPGGNPYTLQALHQLPTQQFQTIVDVGCGTGRQTIALAQELNTLIHAIDSHQPFLDHLNQRAAIANLTSLIQTHCLDMQEVPQVFHTIDLLWSEGAAYNIGFPNALSLWKSAIAPGGFAVISELSWLDNQPPDAAQKFFSTAYPAMRSVQGNRAIAQESGYRVLFTSILPREAWVNGYYDLLEPRAQALLEHPDREVRAIARETLEEIQVFEMAEDSYGYVFYGLQRA
jgi:trans-aconitate methyltransferase